jgi:hypothetical protein
MASVFSFPDPVDEVSARLVAGGVVLLGALALVTGWSWLVALIAVGFIARVASGPTLSPLGQLVTRVIRPRLPVRATYVPGPPKRFAQAIGVCFSTAALVLGLLLGLETAATVVLLTLTVAASLEAFAGICLGCELFRIGMRVGLVPETVCEECANIWARGAQRA